MKHVYRLPAILLAVVVLFALADAMATARFPHRARVYFDVVAGLEIDVEAPEAKLANEIRILILGDNLPRPTAAQWPASVERALKEELDVHYDRPVRVANCTWPQRGSFHALLAMKTVLKHRPDLVILNVGASELAMPNVLYAHSSLLRFLTALPYRDSLARIILRRVDNLRKLYLYGDVAFEEPETFPESLARVLHRDLDPQDPPVRSRVWEQYRHNVSQILKLADARHLPVALVGLPDRVPESREANSALKPLAARRGVLWVDFPDLDEAAGNEALAKLLVREGMARRFLPEGKV